MVGSYRTGGLMYFYGAVLEWSSACGSGTAARRHSHFVSRRARHVVHVELVQSVLADHPCHPHAARGEWLFLSGVDILWDSGVSACGSVPSCCAPAPCALLWQGKDIGVACELVFVDSFGWVIFFVCTYILG
jgi:hypothetical protein